MKRVFVRRGGTDSEPSSVILDASTSLLTAEKKFLEVFGNITTLESDLLLLGAAVYATDRCTVRGEREQSTRDIELSVPVINIGVLQPLIPRIELILRKLSSDSWRIKLRQDPGSPEKSFTCKATPGSTLLFSGGLDSLAAALETSSKGPGLQLVSHITHNAVTAKAQNQLAAILKTKLQASFSHRKFLVSARSVSPSVGVEFDAENSQRTRSFLFITLAGLCARRAGHQKVVMVAENGQMAVHLIITEGRLGPYSTRTAHPEILQLMESFVNNALGTKLEIINPYVHKTKAEVINSVVAQIPEALPIATSCWKNARLPTSKTHCGFCIPCIIRRIAIETYAQDATAYVRDLFNENFSSLRENDDGRRNLADFAEFIYRLRSTDDSEITMQWPELLTPPILLTETLAMYRRATDEATKVFAKYPGLALLLQ